jgi:YD repeat-containing protein
MAGGDAYETGYVYAGGYWDKTDREFRGFESVTVTDPQGHYTTIRFLQDSLFKGRVVSEKQFDAAGNLFTEVQNTWSSQEIAAGVNFVYLHRRDNLVYDGDASGRRTSEEYLYEEGPQRGNLTRVEQYGEVDLETGEKNNGDNLQRRIKTEYVNDTASWIIGLPSSTRVEDFFYQVMRKTTFYYDAKGLLTSKEDWAGTGNVNPITQYSYDGVGNLLTTTDPKGNITRITYDPAYSMFPLTTENALGHKVINEYYGVNGVALSGSDGFNGQWGQVHDRPEPAAGQALV